MNAQKGRGHGQADDLRRGKNSPVRIREPDSQPVSNGADRKSGKPVYMVCNCNESEPGAVVHKDPHQLIEGIMISCFATNCEGLYLYPRRNAQRGKDPGTGD